MRSGVTKRSRQILALLLAVVMVVGVLPTAGVKAEPTTITIKNQYWLSNDNGIEEGTIFKAGDILSGEFEGGGDRLSVAYYDANGYRLFSEFVSYYDGNGYSQIVTYGDNEGYQPNYTILGYKAVVDFAQRTEDIAGILSGNPGNYSDYWVVLDQEGQIPGELQLRALPKYTITWDLDDGQVKDGVTLPKEYIPGVTADIDLTLEANQYPVEKDDYTLDADGGWLVLTHSAEKGDYYDFAPYNLPAEFNAKAVITAQTYSYFACPSETGAPTYEIKLKANLLPAFIIKFEKGLEGTDTSDISGEMDDLVIGYDYLHSFTLPANKYTKPGYIFGGWYKPAQGQESTEIFDEAEFDCDWTDVAGTVYTLYATWKELPTFTIRFHPSNDEDEIDAIMGTMDDYKIDTPEEKSGTIPKVGYIYPGYIFVGWECYDDEGYLVGNQVPDENGYKYIPFIDECPVQDLLECLMDPATKSYTKEVIDLYADWNMDITSKYKITFNNNVPTDEVYDEENFPTRGPIEGPCWTLVEEADWDNYDLDSLYWLMGTDEWYSISSVTLPEGPTNGKDLRHYDFWCWTMVDQAPFAFDNDQADIFPCELGENESKVYYFPYDEKATPTIDSLVKMTDEIGEEKIGNVNYFTIAMKAWWKSKKYNFKFILNNDEYQYAFENKDAENVPYHDGVVNVPALDDSEHYTFAGWVFDTDNTDADYIIKSGNNTSAKSIILKSDELADSYEENDKQSDWISVEKDKTTTITLTALWEPKTYTVTFDADMTGVKNPADQEVEYQGFAAEPTPEPSALGYSFNGWYNPATKSDWNFDRNTVLEDVDLIANWTPKKYDIHFVVKPDTYEFNPKLTGDYTEDFDWKDKEYDREELDKPILKLIDDSGKYKFLGWAFSEDADKPVFEYDIDATWRVCDIVEKANPTYITEGGNEQITLYAVWGYKEYDVYYFVNPKNLPLTPNKEDYTQSGYDDESYSGTWADTEIYDTGKKFKLIGWAFANKDPEKVAIDVEDPWYFYEIVDKARTSGAIIPGEEDETTDEVGNDYIELNAIWVEAHTVQWLDDNGDILDEVLVGNNEEDPTEYEGEQQPKKSGENSNNYKFVGWNDPETDKDGNKTIKPKFEEINPAGGQGGNEEKVKYTITWIDGDGNEIYHEEVAEGDTPSYDTAKYGTPEKQSGGEVTYEFNGWSPALQAVTGDQEYVAQFDMNGPAGGQGGNEEKVKYTITWIDGDGNEIYHEEVTEGDTPKYDVANHGTPEKQPGGFATYEFNGNWSPAIHAVTGDQEYVAQFDLIGPENGQEGQGGQGGQGGNDNPVIIPPTITYYTITWANYDGAGSTKTTQVEAGDRPTYNGTPAKADDAENTYTFIGWTPNITVATGDATYTALFTATKKDSNNNNPTPTVTPKPTSGPTRSRDYKINYYEEQADGTLAKLKKTLNPDTYTYGVGAEIKYGIDKEGYKFLGWYSQKTGKRVTKISKNSKGEKTLIAKFVPIDDGTGEGNGNGSGTPASEFGILFVRLVDYTADSMTLKWQPIEGVDGYDIFGSRCNSKDVIRPYEPIASVGADASEYKMEGLLAKTYYKFYIRAYILVNKEKRYITTSINVHGVTLNDTYGVADEINIDKIVLKYINGKSKTKFDSAKDGASEDVINITMKVGQSLVLVSSEKSNTGKEIREHRPISFESSDPSVCVVGKKKNHKYGKEVASKDNTYKSHAITAVAVGECDINVFAQNGLYKKIHVTVKE